jgi:hypothetical protein
MRAQYIDSVENRSRTRLAKSTIGLSMLLFEAAPRDAIGRQDAIRIGQF